ncbi:MAG: DUF5131 family protein [Candidatus Cloacimonadaceae bacterium]|jgi:protein gp37
MAKTKIEWADEVWNPVWGCFNHCPYCYASKIAKRFGQTQEQRDFIPSWREDNYNRPFAKSTKRVFVNSMSDPMYWFPAWMEFVLERIRQHPEIQFIFLTKGGFRVYRELYDSIYPENVILGITVTRPEDLPQQEIGCFWPGSKWLINIEPMLSTFTLAYAWDMIKEYDWIIIGAETGNRKEKVIPHLEWYMYLLNQTIIPVFMKPSLDKYTPKELIRREYIS